MKAKPFLIGFIVVMLALVAGSIYLAVTTDRADKALVAVASPDGKYKAVRLTVSNDTPAPFCVDTIAIFLSVYPDSFVASDSSYEVYSAPCAAPGKRAALPRIEWTANNKVTITYAPKPGAGKAPRLKDRDMSLFVDISYVKAN
ncbi:MAG: hypothetical protein PSV22_17935 [Pseudolabrys sp.]|nr:hypothetical protein [Pseudolabrys sp.]